MPIYRRASAELRRLHRTDEWRLAGVVVAAKWYPAARDIPPPPARLVEAGLVSLSALPTFIAPDEVAAARTAIWLAREYPTLVGVSARSRANIPPPPDLGATAGS